MRFLFVVQGEGRGHLTQAISLGEMLRRHGHEVVEVLIGKCSNRELPASFVGKMPAEVKVGGLVVLLSVPALSMAVMV